MNLIEIDEAKCLHCGLCVQACPAAVLGMKDKLPAEINSDFCIDCGHCAAVCPAAALEHTRAAMSRQLDMAKFPVIDEAAAELYLRSRRSVRCYKKEAVPREKINRLLDIARFAPTASNSQGISYLVVQRPEIISAAVEATVKWMEDEMQKNPNFHKSFRLHTESWRKFGTDTILRQAPVLILALSPAGFRNGRGNTISAFSYAELYAGTLGLGTCWAGLLEMCLFSHYAPLCSLFDVPPAMTVTGALMAGYPKYRFYRIPERNPLTVHYM